MRYTTVTLPKPRLLAWGAAGMRDATASRVAPDQEYVAYSDYKLLEREFRRLNEDSRMAARQAGRRAMGDV